MLTRMVQKGPKDIPALPLSLDFSQLVGRRLQVQLMAGSFLGPFLGPELSTIECTNKDIRTQMEILLEAQERTPNSTSRTAGTLSSNC